MSLLNYGHATKSRNSNRNTHQNYAGSSVNRRNEVNLLSHNYHNYYGTNPSLSKEYKPTISTSSNAHLYHLTSSTKDNGLLPKIGSSTLNDKKEEERTKAGIGRKEEYYPSSPSKSEARREGRNLYRNKESQTGLNYLKNMPEQRELPLRQSKQELDEVFKPKTPKTLGLVGLNNIGNTCFMNSILQCMLNLPKFNDYFLADSHHKQLTTSSRVAIAYGKLVNLIKNSTNRSQTPNDIKNAVASKKNRFSGYGQQDAQQFLLALLQLLSLELNRSKNPKYKQLKADLTKNSLQEISQQWWNYNRERQSSVVCDYFAGQILSKVVCSYCGNQSIAFDNTWDFDLNFSHNDGGDLLRMIQNFLKEETISQDYYCSKCKAFKECKRKLYLYRLPQIIVFQIKRFSYGKYSKQKLNNRIRAPSLLDLSKVITKSSHHSVKNPIYELVGVVKHSGEINYGHYTADCKNPINGRWYCFNDSSVSQISMGDHLDSSSPYLLFYSKK